MSAQIQVTETEIGACRLDILGVEQHQKKTTDGSLAMIWFHIISDLPSHNTFCNIELSVAGIFWEP